MAFPLLFIDRSRKMSDAKRINIAVWFEIPATQMARAVKFYEQIFAVTLKSEKMGPAEMAVFPYDKETAISGCVMSAPGLKPSADGAVVYLNADPSLDAVLKRVAGAGGKVLLDKTALPPGMGYFAHIADTEGNRVGIHALS
jgi:uncharacterized protein